MQVTRTNFEEILKELDTVLAEATFLTIDTEFTGLRDDGPRINPLDTAETRFHSLRESVKNFLIIQFGLAAFRYDAETDRYSYKAYNFYVFPTSSGLNNAPDPRFLCQASSLEFLVNNGFDFNKWIKEGIPYLTLTDETRLRSELEKSQTAKGEELQANITAKEKTPNAFNDVPIPPDQREFMDDVFQRVERLVSSNNKFIVIDKCNPFQRKLIFTHVRPKFPNVLLESRVSKNKERVIHVEKADFAAQQERQKQNFEEQKKKLDSFVGFSRVIRKITESGKLVVGHNMMLDVCHSLRQFIAPLPEDYSEFKEFALSVFPKMVDTKLMASTPPLKDWVSNSALGDMVKLLQEKPFTFPHQIDCEQETPYSLDQSSAHEAGYDAYLTGLAFITLADFLGKCAQGAGSRVLPDSPFLEPFVNKLNLTRVVDIPYIDMTGPDISPSRDHVFHLTFPKEWRNMDIFQLFAPYGGVQVHWLSDVSAAVSLRCKEQAPSLLKEFPKSSLYTIMSYASYVQLEQVQAKKRKSEKDGDTDGDEADNGTNNGRLQSGLAAKRFRAQSEKTVKEKMENESKNGTVPSAVFDVPESWD